MTELKTFFNIEIGVFRKSCQIIFVFYIHDKNQRTLGQDVFLSLNILLKFGSYNIYPLCQFLSHEY
ncbi:hypothetical protein A5478_01215 [Legionella pneumophila]|nr:hypothetical protein A5478_01215 [Legionella pneumophila]ANH14680.1 hypothetical protein A5480_01215 [Legionella pneumophila]ANH17646.1 hypothetical protein A5479_01215 [Legionella pneumophila]APX18527.1 hypothetical protein A1D14_01215 [Legionella pneumophila]AQL10707.1 hypothetical protein A1D13_01215 [Legionella pneumophila]